MGRTAVPASRRGARFLVPTWLAMLLAAGLAGAVAQPAAAVAANTPVVAYAAVQGPCCGHGTVVAFDATNGTVFGTIAVGGTPMGVAVTPDGSRVFVTNRVGYLSVIDAATLHETEVPACAWATGIAITPDGQTAVVTCSGLSSVQIIDLRDLTVATTLVVDQEPYSVAITPDGSTAYVVNFNGSAATDYVGTVTPIAMSPRATLPPIVLSGREAVGAAMTPDGTRLLVGVQGSTTAASSVDVIDTATGTVVGIEGVDGAPNGIAVAPDGTTAYVASPVANSITAFSSTNGTATQRLGIGSGSLAVTPDQTTLLSADTAAQLVDILDLPSLASRGYAPTNPGPAAVAVTPDQAPIAALRLTRQIGHRVTLDASASTSATSPIARYAWDFGDGKTAVTTTPTVSHTFARKGTYNASVTLTSRAGTSTTRVFTGQTMSRNGSSAARASVPVAIG